MPSVVQMFSLSTFGNLFNYTEYILCGFSIYLHYFYPIDLYIWSLVLSRTLKLCAKIYLFFLLNHECKTLPTYPGIITLFLLLADIGL